MHHIAKKRGITLLALLIAAWYSAQAQVRDSSQYGTDTTSIQNKQKQLKGERITGLVTDGSTSKQLAGVSISVAGFSATITDDRGAFSITVPDYRATLQVSKEGYHTKLVPVFVGKTLSVKLYTVSFPSLFALNNTPFGNQPAARSLSAVSSQSNQDTWSSNSETAGSYYQGRLTGVNAIRSSGTAGIATNWQVRGFTSIYASNKPLYVVDGMIYDTESFGTSIHAGHLNNPLQHLDIRDIESVSVIKDAAGAAVYGTRSANGVVLINTKRASALATQIDFSAYGGFNQAPAAIPVMDAGQYRTYLSDILKSRGLSGSAVSALPYMNDSQATNPDYYMYQNNTDWQKQVFRKSYDQNYYLRVTGGDNIAKYALSVGYLNDKGITDSTGYLRYNTRFNADLNLTQRLTGNANLAFTYAQQSLKDQGIEPQTNPIYSALVKAPFMNTNAVDKTGATSPTLADVDVFGASNPRVIIEKGSNLKKAYRFFGSTNFNYEFSKAFKATALVGITYDKAQESAFIPRLGVANDTLYNIVADSRLAAQTIRYFSLYNDTRLDFNKVIKYNHAIKATAGFRYNHNNSEQDYALGYNSGTDQLISIGNSSSASRIFGGGIGKWASMSTYLSADYSYADKYLFTASVALDGSSRFGDQVPGSLKIGGTRMAVLPAFAAAWVLSSEDFLKEKNGLDLLKLRLSYGWTGNDDIGNYTARQYYVSQNLLGLQGLVRGNIPNPQIQWEVVRKLNAGADAAILDERISFSIDYWNNQTTKMLTRQSVSGVVGIDSYIANNAAMKTRGFDLGLTARILNRGVKWDAGINLGSYKNEVTQLPANALFNDFAGATYITAVGQGANLFYGYRTNGVYATDAEAAAAGLSLRKTSGELLPFKAGDVRFVNVNSSDKVIDESDRVVIGNPNPDIFGSVSNKLHFQSWTLDALITFVSGNELYNYTRSQLESGMNYNNQTVAMLNRWRGEGQVTNIPRASFGDPMANNRFSDRWIEDGSYIRLRTIALTYTIPVKSSAFKYAHVYATANNLLTFTNYLGYDPEFSASGSIFNQGVDNTLEPQFKSFQLGLRIGL